MTPKQVLAHKTGRRRFFAAYAVSICLHAILFAFLFMFTSPGPDPTPTLVVSIRDIQAEEKTAGADVPATPAPIVPAAPDSEPALVEPVLPAQNPEVPIPSTTSQDVGETAPTLDYAEPGPEPEPSDSVSGAETGGGEVGAQGDAGAVATLDEGPPSVQSTSGAVPDTIADGIPELRTSPKPPTKAVTGANAGRGGGGQVGDPRAELAARVGRAIAARKTYPEAARRRGLEGTLVIAFTVDERGTLLGARTAVSSGSDILDKAGLDLLRSVFPIKNDSHKRLELRIPIGYKLEQPTADPTKRH